MTTQPKATRRPTGYGVLLYNTTCLSCDFKLQWSVSIAHIIEHLETCEGPIVQSFRLNRKDA